MAKVQISKWDIAQLFGLEFILTDHDSDYQYYYKYNFRGHEIVVQDSWSVGGQEDANEEAAQVVLDLIAKAARGWDNFVVKNK